MKLSVGWKSIILVVLILLFDQALKIWIKTHMSIGQDFSVMGNWFMIHFVENPGMAFGWKFGGETGKLLLSLFRIVAIGGIIWYIRALIREHAPQGFVLCVSLILAGAIGNMIDSAFYGLIFDTGTTFDTELNAYIGYSGVSQFSCNGYASFLHGCVVDMLSFPIFHGQYPQWFPLWGGENFLFFSPVFNIADSAVTIGVISIIIFHWGYLKTMSKS